MKIKQPSVGVEIIGKIPSLGVTKYVRNGTVVTRVSTSEGRRSNSRGQFIQRQRMRHGIALWKELSRWSPMFTEGKTAYHRFLSLANQLPVIYMPKNKDSVEGSLLMPGIPVSEGSLSPMQLRFGEVDGCLALLDEDFANEMKGWALVSVMGKNCSTQSIVTRCKYYERYTTEEALEEAAKSYGGLK